MPEKPLKEDGRKLWHRVLSSIPHGVKVMTVSVRGTGQEKNQTLPDRLEPPPEPPTPGPFGPE